MNHGGRSERKGKYSVLIVCEGENTEPAYFAEFGKFLANKYAMEYEDGIVFRILPFPPEERKVIEENTEFKRAKKKIEIKNAAQQINEDIEKKYFPEPTRWVRFAQKEAEGGGYNQIWAVFDYDNRPDAELKIAFHLAEEQIKGTDEKVNIAFSSYSFEYWLLLHYELYDQFIQGSECREGEDRINCGSDGCVHSNDCKGAKCLGGYLRVNSYEVGEYNKTEKSTFPAIRDFITKAKYHATYVREHPRNDGLDLWKMKPVTTLDKLIDKLTRETKFVRWHYTDGTIELENIIALFTIVGDSLQIEISRKVKATIVIPIGKTIVYNENFDSNILNVRVQMENEDKFEYPKLILSELKIIPLYASIELEGTVHLVHIKT